MAKQRRNFVSFEISVEEEKAIDLRAKQEGVNRSQYIREAIYFEMFLSGDFEIYKFLGKQAGVIMREVLAGKFAEFQRRSPGKVPA